MKITSVLAIFHPLAAGVFFPALSIVQDATNSSG
jgi:hypothetical protein